MGAPFRKAKGRSLLFLGDIQKRKPAGEGTQKRRSVFIKNASPFCVTGRRALRQGGTGCPGEGKSKGSLGEDANEAAGVDAGGQGMGQNEGEQEVKKGRKDKAGAKGQRAGEGKRGGHAGKDVGQGLDKGAAGRWGEKREKRKKPWRSPCGGCATATGRTGRPVPKSCKSFINSAQACPCRARRWSHRPGASAPVRRGRRPRWAWSRPRRGAGRSRCACRHAP